MKHTPGPWKAANVAPSNRPDKWIVAAISGGDIAWLPFNLATGELRKANARLIAAAPELLQAVRTLLELVPHFPSGSHSAKEVDKICQLVAKAEGER